MPAGIVTVFLQTVASGLLWGCIYALIALGLTLIYGVMEIINFAHGEFLMVAMFLAYLFSVWLGLEPLLSLPLIVGLLFLFGVGTYKVLIKPVMNSTMLAQIFATFGLLIFLRAVAQFFMGTDYRTVPAVLVHGRVNLSGVYLPTPQLVAAGGAVVMFILVYLFVTRTRTGLALMAVAENRQAAALMGIDADRMFALAWGLGAACVGVAGSLLATFYYVYPDVGAIFGFLSFVVVALGGFGSVEGAFLAGLVIGLAEALAGVFVLPSLKYVVVFLIYLVVVLVRPKGLMGKA